MFYMAYPFFIPRTELFIFIAPDFLNKRIESVNNPLSQIRDYSLRKFIFKLSAE